MKDVELPGTREGRARAARIAAIAAGLGLLWVLWDTVTLYPVKLFVVLLHEVSHGLAAVATGGEIREIAVTADEGGYCRCGGGNAFLTLSAGYLGSLGWGALLILAGSAGRWIARGTVLAAGAGVLALTVLYIRAPFALLLGTGFGAALLAVGWKGGSRVSGPTLMALGTVSCLYALLDIKSDVLDRPDAASDATLLAEATGIPAVLWGLLWIGVSVAVCGWLLRRAWRQA